MDNILLTGNLIGEINLDKNEIVEVRYIGPDEIDDLEFAFDHKERLIEFFNQNSS